MRAVNMEPVAPDVETETETGGEEKPREFPFTIKLKTPIDFGSERVEEITLRRGTVRDLKGIRIGTEFPVEHLVLVASRLSGRPVGLIEKLDQDDAGPVFEVIIDFFANSLSTGRKR